MLAVQVVLSVVLLHKSVAIVDYLQDPDVTFDQNWNKPYTPHSWSIDKNFLTMYESKKCRIGEWFYAEFSEPKTVHTIFILISGYTILELDPLLISGANPPVPELQGMWDEGYGGFYDDRYDITSSAYTSTLASRYFDTLSDNYKVSVYAGLNDDYEDNQLCGTQSIVADGPVNCEGGVSARRIHIVMEEYGVDGCSYVMIAEWRAFEETEIGQYVTHVTMPSSTASLTYGSLTRTVGLTPEDELYNSDAWITDTLGVPTAIYHL